MTRKPKGPTLIQYAEQFTHSPQAPKHKRDREALLRNVRKFASWLGRDIPVSELTAELVNEFIAATEQAGATSKTAVMYRYHLQRLWRYAHAQGDHASLPEKQPPLHHASEHHVPKPRNGVVAESPPAKRTREGRCIVPPPRSKARKQKPAAKQKPLTFGQYVERYVDARPLAPHSAQRLRSRVRALCAWYGEKLLVRDVTCELVNEYLSALQESTDLTSISVNSYRGDLRCVWQAAYMEGLNEHPPIRLRRVPKIRERVEAFTHEEIGKLLEAAARRSDYLRNGVRHSWFWRAAILSAYCTGLRRGDLLTFRRDQIGRDGVATVLQHKTGYPVVVKFSQDALEAIDQVQVDGDARILPWPFGSMRPFDKRFARLVNEAGIRRGTFKWLRRAAGSYAESMQPGGGSRLLGHRDPNVFNNHYKDDEIVQEKPIEPPALALVG